MKGFKNSTRTQYAHGGYPTVRKAEGGSVEAVSNPEPSYIPAAPPAPKQSFKEAFASNRSAGKSTFMWNGKKYTTELASEQRSAPKAVQSAPRPAPNAASVPVPSPAPRISAPAPKARPTFRDTFQRSMGDDSPAAKAALDAKAAARGRALKGAVDFVTKGDGKKHPSFKENFSRAMKTGGPVNMTAAERRAAAEETTRPLPASPTPPRKAVPPVPRQPRVTDAMIKGVGEDKAPGERGYRRYAVGGPVPTSGGMPAQGQPLTSQNVNDARVRPLSAPRPRPMPGADRGGLPQSWRDNYAADSARRLGTNPQPTARDLANRAADAARSGGKPPAPTLPPVNTGTKPGYKKGGKVLEKGTGEAYASKGAKAKHEARESYSREMAEHRFGKK
jgi:hypothetical protein